jgi:hypothetical protein
MRQHRLLSIGIIVTLIVLAAIALAVWWFGWDWTGFNGGYSQITTTSTSHGTTTVTAKPPGKTFWDWLQLLIIPAVIAVGGYLFSLAVSRNEQRNTKDNQQEAALQVYIDKVSELLLHERLGESPPPHEVVIIVRARTATVLRILDPIRRASLIQFLSQSGILALCVENTAKSSFDWPLKNEYSLEDIDLRETNFNGVNLSMIHLEGANLQGASLREANLEGTDLGRANLQMANLMHANLQRANLFGANLQGARLYGANYGDSPLALCAACLETTYLARFITIPPNDCPSCGVAVDDHPTMQGCRRWV